MVGTPLHGIQALQAFKMRDDEAEKGRVRVEGGKARIVARQAAKGDDALPSPPV